MPDLKQTRTRLHIVIAALLLLDVAAFAMLMTPLAGRENLRQDDLRQAWQSLKGRQSAPWRGLDKKIPQARQDIDAFYRDRLPTGYSAISTDMGKIAAEAGVKVTSERYTQHESDLPNLPRVEIDADVSGDYLPLVRFINSLERSRLFFIVDDLQLGGEQSGTVKLQIKLETYKRAVQ
jgi:type IV pilus assembly protein PilO